MSHFSCLSCRLDNAVADRRPHSKRAVTSEHTERKRHYLRALISITASLRRTGTEDAERLPVQAVVWTPEKRITWRQRPFNRWCSRALMGKFGLSEEEFYEVSINIHCVLPTEDWGQQGCYWERQTETPTEQQGYDRAWKNNPPELKRKISPEVHK